MQKNLIERLVEQLDTLVPFLGLCHETVFKLIHDANSEWFPQKQRDALPETFAAYKAQVSVSAFLLGYSYFEVFVADLAKAILSKRPILLPKKKQLHYSDVINIGNYDLLLSQLGSPAIQMK